MYTRHKEMGESGHTLMVYFYLGTRGTSKSLMFKSFTKILLCMLYIASRHTRDILGGGGGEHVCVEN